MAGQAGNTIQLDRGLFKDHLTFWKQLSSLDQGQRMVLWASIQRQAYREIGMDYSWEGDEAVPVLPVRDVSEAQDTTIAPEQPGHYL